MGPRNEKRTWFLTYPQNESTMADLLEGLRLVDKVEEYVIAQESHKDGNKHLHAYVKFETGVKLSDAPKSFDLVGKTGNYQPARSPKAVIKYCTKEGDFISSFDVTTYLEKKGKLSVDTIRKKSTKKALEDGDINIHAIKAYTLARSILVEPYEHDDVRGIWIHGPPGTGKSRMARSEYGEVYLKQQNKWFDGYAGEETILIDDFDKQGSCLGHYLKIWADRYACTGEVKGGQTQLCHKRLVVTSNYIPEQLFRDKETQKADEVLCAAIRRRFEFIDFGESNQDFLDRLPK